MCIRDRTPDEIRKGSDPEYMTLMSGRTTQPLWNVLSLDRRGEQALSLIHIFGILGGNACGKSDADNIQFTVP